MVEDLGDFQTPLALVEDVLHCLMQTGQQWTRALEPTCGRGNFIEGLLKSKIAPQEIRGIEIQNHYVQHAQGIVAQAKVMATINQANLFDMDLRRDLVWDTPGSLLVVGNPPWITNAQLGILKSNNMPVKSNFKGFKGLEAVLGRANFDIAEFILLKLITELVDEKPTIALLCKTAVARNVLQFAFEAKLPVSGASIRKIESKKFFGAFVDACLFHFDVGQATPCYQAEIYPGLLATEPESVMGVSNGRFVADMAALQKVSFLDGVCPLTWRQGVKHDAASVMELSYNATGQLYNKLGEIVDVESEYVYPLLKSSDLGGIEKVRQKKAILLPQRYIGEDTAHLELHAPRLWHYLMQHSETFTRRKSSIYAGQPAFALFGIGPYTFAPYKVAISGLYKRWQFQVIGPIDEKPVAFDDTCYFIPCSSAWQAAFIASLLQTPLCLELLNSVVFWDAKRPITKKILQRVDLTALLASIDQAEIVRQAGILLETLKPAAKEQAEPWPADLAVFLQDYKYETQEKSEIVQGLLF